MKFRNLLTCIFLEFQLLKYNEQRIDISVYLIFNRQRTGQSFTCRQSAFSIVASNCTVRRLTARISTWTASPRIPAYFQAAGKPRTSSCLLAWRSCRWRCWQLWSAAVCKASAERASSTWLVLHRLSLVIFQCNWNCLSFDESFFLSFFQLLIVILFFVNRDILLAGDDLVSRGLGRRKGSEDLWTGSWRFLHRRMLPR